MKIGPAILQAISSRLRTIQSVQITFSRTIDGIRLLSSLFDMISDVRFNDEDLTLIRAIDETKDWGGTSNNKFCVYIRKSVWHRREFAELAVKGIEEIRPASESPLNALQSGRQKRRTEAFTAIEEAILTPTLRDEIKDYGLSLGYVEVEKDGFHSFRIAIYKDDNLEDGLRIVLDGWSGNIIIDNKVVRFCSAYDIARKEIEGALSEYLERVTSVA